MYEIMVEEMKKIVHGPMMKAMSDVVEGRLSLSQACQKHKVSKEDILELISRFLHEE
jgi:hypothetical protein|tara:strand:+ start:51 stop:221 length:171 start_codon:yes stop_codon:yes gene_type:complete